MSIVWSIGDLHLDHRLITKYRNVSSAEENNELMVDMIVTKTKKRDVLWLHGDIFFSDRSVYEYAPVISMNVGQVNYILGNHDLQKLPIEKRKLAFQFLLDLGWNIHGIVKHNGMWLSHAPIHPDELRGKKNVHGHCIDLDTEILTPEGWKNRDSISVGDQVYSYDPFSKKIVIDVVGHKTEIQHSGKVYHLIGKGVDIRVTDKHRVPFLFGNKSTYRVGLAEEVFSRNNVKIIKSGYFDSPGIPMTDDELTLYIVLAADGYFSPTLSRITVHKERKVVEVEALLRRMGISFTKNQRKDGGWGFNFSHPWFVHEYNVKGLDKKLLDATPHQVEVIRRAYRWTDGNRDLIFSSKKEEIDLLQQLFTLNGYASKMHGREGHGFSSGMSYQISVTERTTQILVRVTERVKIEEVNGEEFWCITNSNGNFFCRRNGAIHLTGNCHLETIPDERYINVSVDNTNFQLINRQDIIKGWRTNL